MLTVRRVVDERVRLGKRVEHRAGLEVVTPGGKLGFIAWEGLRARGSTGLHIAYGDCRTIDSSQGLTSDEHINALPGGSRSVQGFKNYVASSRHRVALAAAEQHRRRAAPGGRGAAGRGAGAGGLGQPRARGLGQPGRQHRPPAG